MTLNNSKLRVVAFIKNKINPISNQQSMTLSLTQSLLAILAHTTWALFILEEVSKTEKSSTKFYIFTTQWIILSFFKFRWIRKSNSAFLLLRCVWTKHRYSKIKRKNTTLHLWTIICDIKYLNTEIFFINYFCNGISLSLISIVTFVHVQSMICTETRSYPSASFPLDSEHIN